MQAPSEGGVPSVPADRYERQAALDVLHYEIAIDIPAEGPSIAGRTAVLYQAGIGGLEAVRLDLGAAMVVDSVSVDGVPVPFERAGDRLVISASAAAEERNEAGVERGTQR